MPALGSNANVWNTCLRIIRDCGFELRLESDDPEADMMDCFWVAEKNGYDLWAGNPIELLGLVKIYECTNPKNEVVPYWWVVKGTDIIDELAERKWPE